MNSFIQQVFVECLPYFRYCHRCWKYFYHLSSVVYLCFLLFSYIRPLIYREVGMHSIPKFPLKEVSSLTFSHGAKNITYMYNILLLPLAIDNTTGSSSKYETSCTKKPSPNNLDYEALQSQGNNFLIFFSSGTLKICTSDCFEKLRKQNKTCFNQAILQLTINSILLIILC